MLESLRQLYDNIVDFCREQSDAMMIGGAVLVVLIILIAVVRYFLKQDNSKQEADESLEFDEKQYLDKLLGAEAEKESQEEAQTKTQEEAQTKTQEEVQTETQIKENLTEKKEYPYKKNIIFPDELIDEITKASAQNLQEIEIKIQSAELGIKTKEKFRKRSSILTAPQTAQTKKRSKTAMLKLLKLKVLRLQKRLKRYLNKK